MLPGEDLVQQGCADLAAGRETAAALLVAIGADRLRDAGLTVPRVDVADPEHRLYRLLEAEEPAGAHAAYNALIRRLVSFERALEHRRRRGRRSRESGGDRGGTDAPTG